MSVLYLSHLHILIFKPPPSLVFHFPPLPIIAAATQQILATQSLKKILMFRNLGKPISPD